MNALIDLFPAPVRKIIYAVLTFALAVYAIFLATQGDWREFAVSLVSGLVSALATANTNTAELPADPYPNGYNAAVDEDE